MRAAIAAILSSGRTKEQRSPFPSGSGMPTRSAVIPTVKLSVYGLIDQQQIALQSTGQLALAAETLDLGDHHLRRPPDIADGAANCDRAIQPTSRCDIWKSICERSAGGRFGVCPLSTCRTIRSEPCGSDAHSWARSSGSPSEFVIELFQQLPLRPIV